MVHILCSLSDIVYSPKAVPYRRQQRCIDSTVSYNWRDKAEQRKQGLCWRSHRVQRCIQKVLQFNLHNLSFLIHLLNPAVKLPPSQIGSRETKRSSGGKSHKPGERLYLQSKLKVNWQSYTIEYCTSIAYITLLALATVFYATATQFTRDIHLG